MRSRACRLLVVALAVGGAGEARLAPSEGPVAQHSLGPVEMEMRNVNLRLSERIVLQVRHLRGRMVSATSERPPIFDDRRSYVVEIDAGEIAMSTASLTALLNEHVFAYRKAPLKDIEVSVDEGRLKQKGKLDKAIDIPFRVKSTVEATADGRIRVHAKSIKAIGLPVGGLMKVLGLEMDDLVKIEAERGITIDGNDFILDPQRLLPPPQIRGKVSDARIEGEQLVQVFGSGSAPRMQPAARGRNYMYFRGHDLMFGKLTMAASDLEIIDQDPKDPFEMDLDHYNDQLVAGYSKNTPEYGLKTYFPDYDDLVARRRSRTNAERH